VPGVEAVPLGQIDLPVTIGDEGNFRKETLTFEVVGFPGTYHTILGRPAYAKFMVVPNYTYLKLKMPGPKGVITVNTKLQHAYECDVECFHFVDSLIHSNELAEEPFPDVLDISETAKWAACSFKPTKDAKEVLMSDDGCTVCIGSTLKPEQEEVLVRFLEVNLDIFARKLSDMPGISREVSKHKLNIKPSAKPVKHKMHRFAGNKCKAIWVEIKKLLAAGFFREVYHPEWLTNLCW
jgi:hypothetical protein